MLTVARSISSLLGGAALLLAGAGLLGTLLATRAAQAGFADGVIGVVMSGYFFGFLVGTTFAPRLIQRIGHIRAFAMFAAIASSTALVHGLVVQPWAWCLLRIATGTCLVSLYMIVESWLNAQAPSGRRGQVFAAYMAVNFMALAVGQLLFLLYPPGTLQPFMIVALLLSWSLVPIAATRITPPPVGGAQRLPLRRLYDATPAGLAGAIGAGFGLGAFWGLGPVAAQRLGFGSPEVAGFMLVTIVGGALVQWPIGHWSDRLDRRRVLAAVCAGAALCALLACFGARRLGWLLPCMLGFGGLAFTAYPISVALANDLLQPEEMVAGAGSLLMANGVGAALGPMVAGFVMDAIGPRGLLLHFAVVFAALSAYVSWRTRQSQPVVASTHFAPMVRTTPAVLELLPDVAGETAPGAPPPQ